jgi:hypothetical protein
MLDFIGTVVTSALMVFAVNAGIVFMDISRQAKLVHSPSACGSAVRQSGFERHVAGVREVHLAYARR